MSNQIIAALFFGGIFTAVSIPFLIDYLKDGDLGDSSIVDMIKGLEEFDQNTRWLYLLSMTALLPFACFPYLQKKLPPIGRSILIFLTGNAFAFGMMTLLS